MDGIIVVLLVVIVIGVLWIIYSLQSILRRWGPSGEQSHVTQDSDALKLIFAELSHESSKELQSLIYQMSDSHKKDFFEFQQAVNLKFSSMQQQNSESIQEQIQKVSALQSQSSSQLQLLLQEQLSKQEKEFVSLKTQTQQQVGLIKEGILTSLNESIRQLITVNKQGLDQIQETNQNKLREIQGDIEKRMNDSLAQNLKSFETVSNNLGQLQQTAQRMISATSSVDKLNSIFERTSSKAFGDFGERYLESMLADNLNNAHWSKQVQIPGTSNRIDFVLQIGDKRIGIDCKFPVTGYQDVLDSNPQDRPKVFKEFCKSVETVAKSISEKYLEKEYLDQLLMYLPSDGMYAEVVSDENLIQKLTKLKVTIVSPTTIFPLILLIHDFELKQHINENAEEIIHSLKTIQKNVISFQDEFRKLGDKIRQAQQNYDTADRSLVGVHNTIARLETSSHTTQSSQKKELSRNEEQAELLV